MLRVLMIKGKKRLTSHLKKQLKCGAIFDLPLEGTREPKRTLHHFTFIQETSEITKSRTTDPERSVCLKETKNSDTKPLNEFSVLLIYTSLEPTG